MIARLLATPWVTRLIKKYAMRTPHVHLHGSDGTMYMGRWSIIDEFHRDGVREYRSRSRFSSRVLEFLTGYSSVRLHWIRRPDMEWHLHNHPFQYRTFVLSGLYGEEFQDSFGEPRQYRILRSGQTSLGGGPDRLHRVSLVPEEGAWTLFFMTRNTYHWGFDVQGVFVRSLRYFTRKGYGRAAISTGVVK